VPFIKTDGDVSFSDRNETYGYKIKLGQDNGDWDEYKAEFGEVSLIAALKECVSARANYENSVLKAIENITEEGDSVDSVYAGIATFNEKYMNGAAIEYIISKDNTDMYVGIVLCTWIDFPSEIEDFKTAGFFSTVIGFTSNVYLSPYLNYQKTHYRLIIGGGQTGEWTVKTRLIPVSNNSGTNSDKAISLFENYTLILRVDTINGLDNGGADGTPFKTLDKALEYLNGIQAGFGGNISIALSEGEHIITNPVRIKNLHKQGITIGSNVATIETTISSVQSSSGTTGSYSIVLNLASVTGLSVNDYSVITRCINGTGSKMLEGCWKIINVDTENNRVTILSTQRYGAAPSGSITGVFKSPRSIIKAVDTDAFIVENSSVYFSSIIIIGNSSNETGIALDRHSVQYSTATLGVSGFKYGIVVKNNSVLRDNSDWAVSGCSSDGIRLESRSTGIISTVSSTGNNGSGIFVDNHSFLQTGNAAGYTSFSGNGVDGVTLLGSSTVANKYARCFSNARHGIYLVMSKGQFGLSTGGINDNGGWGIRAEDFSMAYPSTGTFSGNALGDRSPATGTVGNNGAYLL